MTGRVVRDGGAKPSPAAAGEGWEEGNHSWANARPPVSCALALRGANSALPLRRARVLCALVAVLALGCGA